jgi:hypothetical protein
MDDMDGAEDMDDVVCRTGMGDVTDMRTAS